MKKSTKLKENMKKDKVKKEKKTKKRGNIIEGKKKRKR